MLLIPVWTWTWNVHLWLHRHQKGHSSPQTPAYSFWSAAHRVWRGEYVVLFSCNAPSSSLDYYTQLLSYALPKNVLPFSLPCTHRSGRPNIITCGRTNCLSPCGTLANPEICGQVTSSSPTKTSTSRVTLVCLTVIPDSIQGGPLEDSWLTVLRARQGVLCVERVPPLFLPSFLFNCFFFGFFQSFFSLLFFSRLSVSFFFLSPWWFILLFVFLYLFMVSFFFLFFLLFLFLFLSDTGSF